jgi:hypothetical protein
MKLYTEALNVLRAAKNKGTATVSTCDAANWDKELHNAMLFLHENTPAAFVIRYAIKWGVYDWTIIYKQPIEVI